MTQQALKPKIKGLRNTIKTDKVKQQLTDYTKDYIVPAAKQAVATMIVGIVIGEVGRRTGLSEMDPKDIDVDAIDGELAI